jgi:hypothetical protein
MAYKKYEESDAVKQAKANLDAQLAKKPGAYQSQWQTQLNDTLQKIQNREKFNYNINADALYQSYKDKFVRQGQQAMQDTMGQAAALTGGYGSSYGQNAGQQAYNAYLQNLGDVVPELYDIARSRYDQEGADLLNMYGILGDNEARDYGRWQDTMDAWQGERDYLAGLYDSERAFDYGKYRDDVADDQWAQQLAAAQAARYSGGGNPTEESTEESTKKPVISSGMTTSDASESAGGYAGTGFAENSTVVRQVLALFDQNTAAADAKAIKMLEAVSGKLTPEQKKSVSEYLSRMGYDIEW